MMFALRGMLIRVGLILGAILVAFEINHRKVYSFDGSGFFTSMLWAYMKWAERNYLPYRQWFFASHEYLWLPNWVLLFLCCAVVGVIGFFLFRKLSTIYYQLRGKLLGLDFSLTKFDFPFSSFDAKKYFTFKPKHSVFLGLTFDQKPFNLEAAQRSTHLQIMGRTGSGKSKLLESMMLQDISEGRGVIFLDGKGDQETKEKFCGMAAESCRKSDLHVFDLVDASSSWTYNPVLLGNGIPPEVVAEKMLSTFPCATDFYRHVQQNLFTLLLQIASAKKKRITLRDLHKAIRQMENLRAFAKGCPDENLISELEDFLNVNGKDYFRNIIGMEAWLRKFSVIEQINQGSGAPEIDLPRIFEKGQLVYFRLPAGYAQTSARDIGQVLLQDLQFMAALRQVSMNGEMKPFSIYVDEFSVFASETFIQAINKARSANIWWTIAHQSYSDLEAISPAFAEGVWDNLRTKIILSQRNAQLCEKISSELGTFKTVERTERMTEGSFFTRKAMGEASTKMVDEYVLHPNFIKNLHPFGQGYVVGEKLLEKDSYVGLNFGQVQVPRVEIHPGKLKTVKTIGGKHV
jgi:energy-coupling factor transporter ATP-binding protein EcfA2